MLSPLLLLAGISAILGVVPLLGRCFDARARLGLGLLGLGLLCRGGLGSCSLLQDQPGSERATT